MRIILIKNQMVIWKLDLGLHLDLEIHQVDVMHRIKKTY